MTSTYLQISTGDAAELLAALGPEHRMVKRFFGALEEHRDPELACYRQYAIEHMVREGETEFDDTAIVSAGGDEGAYVMAWVWVSDDDIGLLRVAEVLGAAP